MTKPDRLNAAHSSEWGDDFEIGEDHSYYLAGAERATAAQCAELDERFRKARLEVANAPSLSCTGGDRG